MSSGFGGHDEREQTLNQLLVEMDGFDASKGVIIMAATNRPDVLDPALVRPGRFDRQVVVDRPDLLGREEILRVHARGVALDPSVDLKTIAARTPGFTGADLANVVNEAALLAARREKNAVTAAELEEAIDRASVGLERKSRRDEREGEDPCGLPRDGARARRSLQQNSDPVHRITIIPRGTAALGLTWTRPLEDRFLSTEPELKDLLSRAMGGRVAEEIVFSEISTGAQNDLEMATQIARAMVTEYGMSEKVGPMSLGHEEPNPFFGGSKVSAATAQTIDEEVTRLLNEAHDQAERILVEHRDLLDSSPDCCWSSRRSTGRTSTPTRPARSRSPTRDRAPRPAGPDAGAHARRRRAADAGAHAADAADAGDRVATPPAAPLHRQVPPVPPSIEEPPEVSP